MPYTPELGRAFWFEFDRRTKYSPDLRPILDDAGAFVIQNKFADTRADHTYPNAFRQLFEPRKASWATIAEIQTNTFQEFFATDWSMIQSAFEDFGQGTLFDPDEERRKNDDSIHTMDVQGAGPPVGYHRWHASLRVMQLLGIGDADWLEKLDTLVGLAWGIQSFARPKQQQTANPPVPQAELQALRNAWLALTPERRDRQYDAKPRVGYHPSPRQPLP